MQKQFLLLLLLSLFIGSTTTAQSEHQQINIGETFVNDVEHFFNLGIGIAKSPFSFSSDDWCKTGATIGGTALLFTVDKSVRTFSQSNQSNINNKIFNLDAYYGSAYTAIFTSAIYGYGLFAKNKSIRKLGLNASEAFIYSVAITGILKTIIGRRRPYAGENHLFFKPLQITNDKYHSLPSGHTTAVFAVSTVMANYLDNTIWKVFWYGTAGLVGASRVYHNKHWISDVFLGAAIGYFVGSFTVNFDKEGSKYFGMNITPYFTFNKIGISLKF